MKMHERDAHARIGALLRCAVACLVMVWAVAGPTSSIAWASTKIVGDLALDAPETVELPRIDLFMLPLQVSPESIQTGISCGMLDMCGQDPCLCGSPDSYGACACNGITTTYPALDVQSSNPDVVQVVWLFGKPYLLVAGSGSATISVDASLIHYNDASRTIQVQVDAFGPLDVAKIIALSCTVIVLVLIVFLVVRFLARGIGRFCRFAAGRKEARKVKNKERLEKR